ncbi:hypothetical protein DYB32_003713 [Aphanomyces invadans]|uniref:Uncharacterized protein n=1 Tax=Aphanomyces invadans TaxID=157072 RepID=A0A3R6Z0P9_9STRA|nr:hypothetical protein DYB32_003713 [Aphanomyces invadans]
MLPRPSSPLPVAPAAVLDHLAHEAHPHVKPSDLRHINTWLHSLDVESKNFTSYFLFCEMKFRESSVLTTGKPMPNRLRTAVAFHCLQHATSLFGRYQHVLGTICQSLGAAIYSDYDARHVASRQHAEASTVSAVDWYEKGTAYFQMAEQLRVQVDGLQARKSAEFEAERLREEVAALTSQCDALKRLRGRNTRPSLVVELQNMGAMDKVDMIFKTFQSFDAANRRNILGGLIQTVEQNLSAEMLFDVVQAMAHEEGERLAQMLMREYDVGTTKKTTNEHVKKLQRFVTGFASTLKEVNKSVPVHEAAAAEQTTAELQAERATFEKMLLLKTEMQTLKENHEIELQFEMDKTKLFEEECKELMTKYQDALKRIPKPPEVSDHAVQVDIMEAETATKRKKKRGDDVDDDDGFRGISDVIADANLPAKKIRKIFSKKHAMALDDVAGTIASLYQAKMTQDIHDDCNGKPRSGFLNLVEDLFILYYGLKELAIGQLICIDTAVHKFCEVSDSFSAET